MNSVHDRPFQAMPTASDRAFRVRRLEVKRDGL